MPSSIVIVSIGISLSISMGMSPSIDMMSFIGLVVSSISFEIFLTACLSLLSNKLSSIQMLSVPIFLYGLLSSKMSLTKLMASVCIFCCVTALLTLSDSRFIWGNLSFIACVSALIVWESARCLGFNIRMFSFLCSNSLNMSFTSSCSKRSGSSTNAVLSIISLTFWGSSSSRLSLLRRVYPLIRKLLCPASSEMVSNSTF